MTWSAPEWTGTHWARILPSDFVAGVTVALVLIPQSLAYAQLAGMPAYRGLYAAAVPAIAAALVASSPYLQTGPVALTCLLTFGALSTLAAPASREYVALGLLLALIVGGIRLALGLLRAGVVAYLISQPMLLGFVPAAAILIVASQLATALGSSPPESSVLAKAGWALSNPGSWELASMSLALLTLALITVSRRFHRRFPGALLAVGLGVVYSTVAGYRGPTVGSIPEGLPPLSLNLPWDKLPSLLLAGATIALVGFVEASSIARTFATRERQPWDANREFVGQGLANVAAGVSGGFPVGGSFSRSALNHSAGARTRWSGAVTGLTILAFLPFASSLSALPLAVLSAVVISAAIGLIRLLPIFRLGRYSKPQFLVSLLTFVLTLALAPRIELAVLVASGLAIAIHLWRELQLEFVTWVEPETLHIRPRGVLWFGTEGRLERAFVRALADNSDVRRLELHLDGLGRIDITGALALRAVLGDLRNGGVEVNVVDVRPRWSALVERVIVQEKDPLGRTR